MESGEEVQNQPDKVTHVQNRHEENSRAFFTLLGSVGTIILLSIFLNLQLDGFTRMLVLLGIFALVLVGIIVIGKHGESKKILAMQDTQLQPEDTAEEIGAQEIDVQDDIDFPTQPALSPFEELVREALNSIPEEFHERMTNLAVIVEDRPDVATLVSVGASEGQSLLGLYHGVPLTALGHAQALMPEQITIYQNTIERYCGGDPERIRAQVRATLLHEVAHHFGMGHAEMPIWIK